MALKSLNLDDRRFEDLLDAAIARAKQSSPAWTDLSAGDPGRVLLELFAYLTEVMIYRLNRLPEKAYVEFLRLLGVQLRPPTAAVATLQITLKAPQQQSVQIPRGTRIAAERAGSGGEAPVFMTAETIEIAPGTTSAEVRAYHCERIEAELLGTGSGFPGQTFSVRRAPIVASTADAVDFFLGVESSAAELGEGAPVRRHDGKAFRIWAERQRFGDSGVEDEHAYLLDRVSGIVTFAPALRGATADGGLTEEAIALAAVPGEGREIRVWYCTGGGPAGNVSAGNLTKLKDPIPGSAVEVTNASPATGGRAAETLEHALGRGPQELHSLQRAVTAGDFEALTLRVGGVSRARAYTKHALWRYAPRGTVEVVCVAHIPPERYGAGPVTAEMLHAHESRETLDHVRGALEQRRPLGTACVVRWGNCKKVRVKARVVVFRQEDSAAVRDRVLQRLYDTITPIDRGAESSGWEFGRPLSTYDVYRILSGEPGVRYVDPIRLCVDEVPAADVSALSPDAFQPNTWYAASGDAVFRTLNGGDGWERIARIEGGKVRLLEGYPREAGAPDTHAGLIAAITEFAEGKSRVHLSRDCGESWTEIGARPEFRIEDMAWTDRDGEPVLLLATAKGLYELATRPGANLKAILVDPQQMDLGFYAVAVSTDLWGQSCVAVAARARGGVYLSQDGGKPGTFRHIGLENEKVRVLSVHHHGAERFLWAGMDAAGEDAGTGCARWQLPDSPEGWHAYGQNWEAGGCLGLAFVDAKVLAGTRRHGVLQLDLDAADPKWAAPDVKCGLPLETLKRMRTVDYVAAAPGGSAAEAGLVMAATAVGIYRSSNRGVSYEHCSEREFADRVTLPQTWLFCSDEHEIEVSHDAAL
jgi:hypothetical protein